MSEPLHGLLAEFDSPERLIAAALAVRHAGYTGLDAYTPFPVDGLAEALALPPSRLSWLVAAGGLAGGALGYFMQWYAAVIAYPIHVAGRPEHSWPAFIPIAFEMAVLGAAFTALFGMAFSCRLTRLHHPLHAVDRFQLASTQAFFLCVEASDPRFDLERVRDLLDGLQPASLHDVPA